MSSKFLSWSAVLALSVMVLPLSSVRAEDAIARDPDPASQQTTAPAMDASDALAGDEDVAADAAVTETQPPVDPAPVVSSEPTPAPDPELQAIEAIRAKPSGSAWSLELAPQTGGKPMTDTLSFAGRKISSKTPGCRVCKRSERLRMTWLKS